MYSLLSIVAALALASSITPTFAKCCGSGECVSWSPFPGRPGRPDGEICNRWKCEDGFVHGHFQCCGLSKCNVFCCNCDSVNGQVCRSEKGLRARSESDEIEVVGDLAAADAEMFRLANTGETGNMTLEEFAAWFGAEAGDVFLKEKFDLYDKNGDGYLQIDEMRLS